MKIYFTFLFFALTSLSHAEVLSRNITVNSNKINIIKSYSIEDKTGLIHLKRCDSCPVIKLALNPNSLFILDGKSQTLDKIRRTQLTQPSKAVRIQYNHEDNSVNYIRWYPITEF